MIKTGLSKYLLNTVSKDKWKGIGVRKRAGVLVPLFSIYSQRSIGIGDFNDLRLLIDWAKLTGNSIVQLLPLNETSSLFCPYDSVSSFALEPVYICLEAMPLAKNKSIRVKIENLRKSFPAGSAYVDYAIKREKMCILWEMYLLEKPGNALDFKKFREENAYWLWDFALYQALKDFYNGSAWYDWDDKFKNRDRVALENFQEEHEAEVTFQEWVQWLAFKQFKEVRAYAQAQKVLLNGDLPILVSRDSVETWVHPEFFKFEYASGAPPDMYCARGQRWGMPTYNWQRLQADGFRLIKEKLKFAQEFYDILRIDHVVGLFRIWSIPYNEPLENRGLNGFFDPKDENDWAKHGRDILSVMLKNTKMLLCAEDLGVIPKICPKTLEEFGIPGNDVQRWVKDWKSKHDFLKPQDYRGLSVAMLSTPDTSNFPAWWENEAGTVDSDLFIRKCNDHRRINFKAVKDKLFDSPRSQHGRLRWLNSIDSVDKLVSILGKKKEELADFIDLYANCYREKEKLWQHLGLSGPMREKSDREILAAALKMILESNAIFCINTIIDWLYLTDLFKGDPYQYRINTPGTISKKNWSLTIPIPLEELLRHKVNQDIRVMIASSGRI